MNATLRQYLQVTDPTLSVYERQKVEFLNGIGIFCMFLTILLDISYLLLGRYPQMIIVTGSALFIFLPTLLLQRVRLYTTARIFFSSLILLVMTLTCLFNIHRGEYLNSENILIVLAPLFIVLFERWMKRVLYSAIVIIFFIVRSYDVYTRAAEFDKIFFSASTIYLILFLGIYFFVNSYKVAYYRIFLDQSRFIVELGKQKRQLEIIDESKNKLFSIVAHDLRRPVHSLSGLLQLEEGALSEADRKKFMKNVNENILGINAMIENVLAWAQSQLKGFKSEIRPFSLSEMLDAEIKVLDHHSQMKEIRIIRNYASPLEVRSDTNHLALIVRNLVNNSIKFTPKGGNVTVKATQENDALTLEVADDGLGMDKRAIASIHARHLMSNSRGTEGESGSGLGLALTLEALDRIGGQLTVESEVGKGSRFIVRIPV